MAMETFQWLRDVLRSPRGTPTTSPRATPPATPRKAQGVDESDEVHEALGPTGNCGLATAVAERGDIEVKNQQWRVVWASGVNVRSTKDLSSGSLGTRQAGTMVCGHEEDGWLALSDEPGFITIAVGGSTLVEKVAAHVQRWEVVSQTGVNVRRTMDRASDNLGLREKGTIVFGHEENGWVTLSDEPGFIVVSDGGCTLLEQRAQSVDLEVMMAAAETRRVEVEAQATRLVALLSGVGSPDAAVATGPSSAAQPLLSGSLPRLGISSTATKGQSAISSGLNRRSHSAEPGSPLLIVPPAEAVPKARAMLTASPAESVSRLPSGNTSKAPAMFGTPESAVAATISDSPAAFGFQADLSAESPDSGPAAAAPEVPDSPLQSARSESAAPPPPPLSLANPKVYPAGLSIPAPLWRSTSTLRSRSGPPGRLFSEPMAESGGGQLAAASCSPRQRPAERGDGQLAVGSCSPGPHLERAVRQRLTEAKGKVDQVMSEMSDVKGRLGMQENRIASLTQSLRSISEADSGGGPGRPPQLSCGAEHGESTSLRPEVCMLFNCMVEEMSQMSELAVRGEQASRQVEDARVHLENLYFETTALGLRKSAQPSIAGNNDQANQLMQSFRRELSEAIENLRRQDLGSLREDLDVLKVQLRSVTEAAGNGKQAVAVRVESADDRFSLLSSDVTALRGTLAETVGMLRSELCQLAGEAPQVTRQDLEDALLQVRQDVATSLSTAFESLREDTSHLSQLLGPAKTVALPAGQNDEHDLARFVAELGARLDKVSASTTDVRRNMDSLQEDFAAMQTRKIVTQQELGKTTEEFRLMLDMSMQKFHSATRQELAQTSSQLRRELRPLADFGANEGEAATRRELREGMDQLRLELEPLKNGSHGSSKSGKPTWEELVSVVENLSEDVAQLGEKSSQGEMAMVADLAQARHSLAALEEDMKILKAQRSLQGEEAKMDKDELERLLLGQQQTAFDHLRVEVSKDIVRLVGRPAEELAIKGSPGGVDVVTRRELQDAVDSIRHEVAMMVNGSSQGGDSVTRQELANLVDSLMGEMSKRIEGAKDIPSRLGDVAEVAETERNLARLNEEVAFLKARHGVLGEEASRTKEAVEQRFGVVQHELNLAIEELRARLPAASPTSPGSSGWPVSSPALSRALGSPPAGTGNRARGELLDTQKDFGSLRDDLSSLKSRQEFLKQELKCLVDSASRP